MNRRASIRRMQGEGTDVPHHEFGETGRIARNFVSDTCSTNDKKPPRATGAWQSIVFVALAP